MNIYKLDKLLQELQRHKTCNDYIDEFIRGHRTAYKAILKNKKFEKSELVDLLQSLGSVNSFNDKISQHYINLSRDDIHKIREFKVNHSILRDDIQKTIEDWKRYEMTPMAINDLDRKEKLIYFNTAQEFLVESRKIFEEDKDGIYKSFINAIDNLKKTELPEMVVIGNKIVNIKAEIEKEVLKNSQSDDNCSCESEKYLAFCLIFHYSKYSKKRLNCKLLANKIL